MRWSCESPRPPAIRSTGRGSPPRCFASSLRRWSAQAIRSARVGAALRGRAVSPLVPRLHLILRQSRERTGTYGLWARLAITPSQPCAQAWR